MIRSLSGLAATVGLSACISMGPNPYGPLSFDHLDLSPEGTRLAAVAQDGTARVWDLRSRRTLFERVGSEAGTSSCYRSAFLVFRGESGEVVGDCGCGRVCSWEIVSGREQLLLEHAPEDQTLAGRISQDGKRMVFGTRGGAIFTFDVETAEVVARKPIDRWTAVPYPIYTLEGLPSLEKFVSASAGISAAMKYERGPKAVLHKEDGWMEVPTTDGRSFKSPLWRGICVWLWDGGEPEQVDGGFSDKVRADFSADGSEFAIHQQGSSRFVVYAADSIREVQDLSDPNAGISWGADGLRFVDPDGRYIAVLSYHEKKLMIVDRGDERVSGTVVPLRHWSAGGRRPMVTFPEKRWIFIGLRDGGVDWYQFRAEPKPSLEHVATLR